MYIFFHSTANDFKCQTDFGFYKEIFYSEVVRSQLNQEELHTSQLYYVNGLTHILASLYKAKLDRQYAEIRNDVNQELIKNKIMYSEIKCLPNRMKYLLYRLNLLKMAFTIQGMK